MSSIDTVSDISPRIQYVASAAQTDFDYPFPIFVDADLVVDVDGATQALSTDYTVSGAGDDAGGTVTFLSALAGGEIVTVYRDTAIERTTDFQQNGQWKASSTNDQLDKLTVISQEIAASVRRALRIPVIAAVDDADIELPPANWANKYLTFDADGKPTPAALSDATMTQATVGLLLYPVLPSEGAYVTNVYYPYGWAQRYGCTANDGTTDESTYLQNAVDANKGGMVLIPAGLTVVAAGILLSGSTYNDTKITVEGTFKLKTRATSGTSNFGGAWVGIILQSCDNNVVDVLDANGNRTAQPDEEHCYLLGIAGASNLRIPRFFCREIRGDGIYVSQSDWAGTSTNPTDIAIGQVRGVNSANDGRNLVSIISCDGFTIDDLYSNKIGGTVGGTQQPGGLDIEPNQTYQTVRRGTVGNVLAITAGTAGCGIAGKSVGGADATDWNVYDVSFGNIVVIYTASSGTTAGVNWSRHLNVTVGRAYYNCNAYKLGVQIDYCAGMKGNFYLNNMRQGSGAAATLGFAGTVSEFDLYFDAQKCPSQAILAVGLNRGKIRGRVGATWSATATYGLYIRPLARTITQTGVMYSVDIPSDGLWAKAVTFETTDGGAMTFGAGTCLKDCDFSGFSVANTYASDATHPIPSINCVGRNVKNGLTAAPGVSVWAQFDEVVLDQTAGGTAPRAKCITGGSPGTWKTYGVMAA